MAFKGSHVSYWNLPLHIEKFLYINLTPKSLARIGQDMCTFFAVLYLHNGYNKSIATGLIYIQTDFEAI